MNTPKFSVVLIGRNEEKTLPRLVKSLSEFQEMGGEIILVDTGSTDNTAEVGRSLGCKVEEVGDRFRVVINKELSEKINSKFIVEGENNVVEEGQSLFDYSSARNYAATLSSNDMIATPDCDEIWTAFDIDKINKYIESGFNQFEYNFVFAHDEFGKPLIQFMHSKFYDRRVLKWVGIIHEVLTGDSNRMYLPENIAKLEHFQNVETNRSHYLTGLALDCFENPENDRNSHYFARELMYRGRFKSAIKEFERHISMNKWPTEASQSMLFIGDCYQYLGNDEETVSWYMKAFNKEPNRREPLMKLAEFYYTKGRPTESIIFAEGALKVPGVSYYANHQPYYEHTPHEILYWAYWQQGDKEKSKEHFYKALAFCPQNPKFLSDKSWYEEVELPFTGERVVVDKMENRPDILREHLARYNFAKEFVQGLSVIDAACGSGYGKEILNAKEYFGVDVSLEAVEYATKKYGEGYSVENLENGISKEFDVDAVVSFETIEHLEDPSNFLNWVKEHSKMFVFSIPINMPSEFHKQVYSIEQIKELINKYFPHTYFYGQVDNIISADLVNSAQYIVGVAFTELPTVDFIIPTLGREEGLERCIKSIQDLNYPTNLITIKAINDEPRMGVPLRLKEGIAGSDSEWIVYASNDIEFTHNSLFIAITDAIKNNKEFVAFNTGEVSSDEGNICEHFMIKRSLIPELGGEVFDTDFNHVGVDNLLWAKLKKLGKANRNTEAIVKHFHWSKTGEPLDVVYTLAWNEESVKRDRELLEKKLKELNK